MRSAATSDGWELIEVADLGGSPFLVGDRVVWYVSTGSPKSDRELIRRAIRTYQTTQGRPEKR